MQDCIAPEGCINRTAKLLLMAFLACPVNYVTDIPSMVSSPTFMFADDAKIFRRVKSSDDYSALQNNAL